MATTTSTSGPTPSGADRRQGEAPIGATIDTVKQGTTYATAGGAGKSLYGFGSTSSPVPDSYIGNVNDDESILTWQWEIGSSPANPGQNPITVAWSRVRYTGYGLLVVDSICGFRQPKLKVSAVMEDGVTLIDEFSIVRS